MRIEFNSGVWTDEEHQGFLRGVEVYGRGSWGSIGIFVPSRSPLQIEAHARQHFAGVESAQPEEMQQVVERPRSDQAHFSRAWSSSSPSVSPLRDGGSSGGGGGGGLWEPPVVGHLVPPHSGVPASNPEEELGHHHVGVRDPTAVGIVNGANGGDYGEQQQQQQQQQQHHHHQHHHHQQQPRQQASLPRHGCIQAGEPAGNPLARGAIPYPHRRIWGEPPLGQVLRGWCALDDFGGVL